MDEEIEKHPSYGCIGWSRQQTNSGRLFQSEMNHQDIISIRISSASIRRSLHTDRVHSDEPIAEVMLSPAQFTQFITAPNRGDNGSPCTIRWVKGDGWIDAPKKQDRYSKYKKEISEDVAEIKDQIVELEGALNAILGAKGSIKKSDVKDLSSKLSHLRGSLFANLPFLQEKMNEHMEKVVEQGRVEIESYIENKLRQHGLEHLRSGLPMLENKTGNDEVT